MDVKLLSSFLVIYLTHFACPLGLTEITLQLCTGNLTIHSHQSPSVEKRTKSISNSTLVFVTTFVIYSKVTGRTKCLFGVSFKYHEKLSCCFCFYYLVGVIFVYFMYTFKIFKLR